MAQDIWLSMDEVCNLTGEVKETVIIMYSFDKSIKGFYIIGKICLYI